MGQTDLQFGGLAALDLDERIPVQYAIDAKDCIIDYGGIRGRPGYRRITAAAIGAGTVQFLGRFRPSNTAARTVVVRGGEIFIVTDPSTETATDGVATSLGVVFGANANISGVQLGKYFYLASDEAGVAWRRITPSFTLEAVTPVAKLSGTGSTAAPALVLFSALADTYAPLVRTVSFGGSGWNVYYGAGVYQEDVTFNLGANQDWSAYDWLLLYVCPMTRSTPGVFPIEISVGDNLGNYTTIATVVTNNRDYPSPGAVYAPLTGVPAAIRSAARNIRFRCTNPQTDTTIAVYGYMPIPTNPGTGRQTYYVTYYNSATRQESELSDAIEVTLSPFALASYPHVYAYIVNYYYHGETANATPNTGNERVFNFRPESTLPTPTPNDLVPVVSVNGVSQVAAATMDKLRLYKQTTTGVRLVKEIANPGVGVAYSIPDDQGSKVGSNALYKPGGTPQPVSALSAWGTRLFGGGDPTNPNRMVISSAVPFAQSTDPFPQFPASAVETADGWQFDLAPTSSERLLWAGLGDYCAYIGTSSAMYYMHSLEPNIVPYKVYHIGPVGRRAACFAGDTLYWCASDGLKMAIGRSYRGDLAESIRRTFLEWLIPDDTTEVSYRDQKLFVTCGTRELRYDFVRGRIDPRWGWTKHNLTHTMRHQAMWQDDPGVTKQRLWMLATNGQVYRRQLDATSDDGSAIPGWTYSTGYIVLPNKGRVRMAFMDVTGNVTFRPLKDSGAGNGPPATVFGAGEKELPSWITNGYKWRFTLAAANDVAVRRLMYELEGVDGQGS